MSKTSLIQIVAAVLLVLVAIGILLALFLRPSTDTGTDTATSSNPFGFSTGTGTTGTATEPTFVITAAGGEAVKVPDFVAGRTSTQIGATPDDVQYELTPYPAYDPSAPYPTHAYDVQYNAKGSQFVVTLNEEPLGASRLSAEAFLRDTLDLSDVKLCTLNILVGVPYSVNPSLSYYQNLGLSFCQNAFPLP